MRRRRSRDGHAPYRTRTRTRRRRGRTTAAAERLQDGDQEQDDIAAPFPPQAGEEVSEEEVHDDGDNDDSGGDAAIPSAQPKLYLPEAVLERTTRLVWTKVQGARQHSRWGGTRQKKAVTEWRELLLVKWAGYSVAESTWEADIVFYEQHYPNLLAVHAARRVPAKLVGGRRHTNPQTGVPHYKVQWQGTRWTTMEPATRVETSPEFRDVLVASSSPSSCAPTQPPAVSSGGSRVAALSRHRSQQSVSSLLAYLTLADSEDRRRVQEKYAAARA